MAYIDEAVRAIVHLAKEIISTNGVQTLTINSLQELVKEYLPEIWETIKEYAAEVFDIVLSML